MRRELERIEIPSEHEARERAWAVVRAAYAGREQQPRAVPLLRPVLVAAALAIVVAAALSPPGRAVIESVREAVGVDSTAEAILELPATGRILVNATSGPWIVSNDGSRRSLGRYGEASWSPQGLFVVAARGSELFALTPTGDVRWAHAHRSFVDHPRWAPSGFRIAYYAGAELRIIAGDGTGDRLLAHGVDHVAPAWRPGARHVLAFADGQRSVAVVDADSNERLWRAPVPGPLVQLLWAPDASRLLVVHEGGYVLLGARGGRVLERRGFGRGSPRAAFAPRGHRFALAVTRAGRSEVRIDGRVAFAGAGLLDRVAWSPDGRWLLVSWASANQWVFVRVDGVRRIAAVSNVREQFSSSTMPRIAGWCCP